MPCMRICRSASRGHLAGDLDHVAVVDADLLVADDLSGSSGGMRFHTSAGSVCGDCMKIAPPGTRPLSVQRAEDRRRVVDAQQVDVLQLAVHV